MKLPDSYAAGVRLSGWGNEKQLVAAADVDTGVLLVGEYPVAFIETQADEDDEGPWLLLEGLLSTPSMFERVVALDLKLTKWELGAVDEAKLDRLAKKYGRNPKKLAHLYHRVAANNLRYAHEDVTGYGIWPIVSRSNHSCDPNAQVRGSKDRPLAQVLLATRPIAQGTPVCWNYYSDPAFLSLDWRQRNARLLRDFRFVCRCPRCEAERVTGS